MGLVPILHTSIHIQHFLSGTWRIRHLWDLAVRILGAIKTSVYIYLAPVVTAAASVIVLHEKITFLSGLGIVLVLGGLLLSEQKKKLFLIRGRKHTENVVE